MTNNTLKSTLEAIIASNALIVVTLEGTFNAQTGAPVLSARTRPDQRKKFLAQYAERVASNDAKDAEKSLREQIAKHVDTATEALSISQYDLAIKAINSAAAAQEQLDMPRMYYRVKPNVDLRTVAEKRAAKKAENAAKKVAKQAEKDAKAAQKLADKVEQNTTTEAPKPVTTGKTTKKAA